MSVFVRIWLSVFLALLVTSFGIPLDALSWRERVTVSSKVATGLVVAIGGLVVLWGWP